jgi:hypothetical protein
MKIEFISTIDKKDRLADFDLFVNGYHVFHWWLIQTPSRWTISTGFGNTTEYPLDRTVDEMKSILAMQYLAAVGDGHKI